MKPFEPTTKYERTIKGMLNEIFPYDYHSRGMYGAMEYVLKRKIQQQTFLQEESAEKWSVTTVTIRNQMKKIQNKVPDMNLLQKIYEKYEAKKK